MALVKRGRGIYPRLPMLTIELGSAGGVEQVRTARWRHRLAAEGLAPLSELADIGSDPVPQLRGQALVSTPEVLEIGENPVQSEQPFGYLGARPIQRHYG